MGPRKIPPRGRLLERSLSCQMNYHVSNRLITRPLLRLVQVSHLHWHRGFVRCQVEVVGQFARRSKIM